MDRLLVGPFPIPTVSLWLVLPSASHHFAQQPSQYCPSYGTKRSGCIFAPLMLTPTLCPRIVAADSSGIPCSAAFQAGTSTTSWTVNDSSFVFFFLVVPSHPTQAGFPHQDCCTPSSGSCWFADLHCNLPYQHLSP